MTRFAVIAEQSEGRTGRDKTTLMVRLAHEAGALVQVIEPFRKNNVNFTWIESFPAGDLTDLFFIDVEGHADDDPVKRALDSLRRRAERLKVLGSYPKGESVEG